MITELLNFLSVELTVMLTVALPIIELRGATPVAIPLPGTGVWSGSLAGALLDMRFKWAFPAILVGNMIAGILIMMLSNGVVGVFNRW